MRWFRLSFTIDLTNATAMFTAGGLGAGRNPHGIRPEGWIKFLLLMAGNERRLANRPSTVSGATRCLSSSNLSHLHLLDEGERLSSLPLSWWYAEQTGRHSPPARTLALPNMARSRTVGRVQFRALKSLSCKSPCGGESTFENVGSGFCSSDARFRAHNPNMRPDPASSFSDAWFRRPSRS
jgi:hypothetical protein